MKKTSPIRPVKVANHEIGPGKPIFLIAEAGSNFNGDLSIALKLIDEAARAGWDAVKFQLFRADSLYPPNCGMVDTPMGVVDLFRELEKNELPPEWLPRLKHHAEAAGLVFLCTPFDEIAAAQLAANRIEAFKIASAELNHLPLLRQVAKFSRPVLCSTGFSPLEDVEEAIQCLRTESPALPLILFHCISTYPTPLDQANLRAIETLGQRFRVPVGFSDHTTDYLEVAVLASAVGASAIEKHFTLSRSLPGLDHSYALEPHEMRQMAATLREMDAVPPPNRVSHATKRFGAARVESILGHGRKEIMPCEADLYPCDKRSIHAVVDIGSHTRLTTENLRVLRSERNLTPGLHPRHWTTVLGARIVRPLRRGEGLQWEHLQLPEEKSCEAVSLR